MTQKKNIKSYSHIYQEAKRTIILKDHKPNFQPDAIFRLINLAKREIEKIHKFFPENINTVIGN